MTVKKRPALAYRKIEINTDDRDLRRRLLDGYESSYGYVVSQQNDDERVLHFKHDILDRLILNGSTENDTMVECAGKIAKELGVSKKHAIRLYNRAWRQVKQIIKG